MSTACKKLVLSYWIEEKKSHSNKWNENLASRDQAGIPHLEVSFSPPFS